MTTRQYYLLGTLAEIRQMLIRENIPIPELINTGGSTGGQTMDVICRDDKVWISIDRLCRDFNIDPSHLTSDYFLDHLNKTRREKGVFLIREFDVK